MKKLYISYLHILSVILSLLFTVQLQLSEAFGAIQQDDVLKFSTKELKSDDHLNLNEIFRQNIAGRSGQRRKRLSPDSLRASWMAKAIAAAYLSVTD